MKEKQQTTKPVKAKQPAKKVIAEKPKVQTLHDKYRKHIETAKDGYLRDLKYPEAMEILRYIQDKTGHKLGLSMSCASCLVSLVKTFANLEK